MSSYRFLGRLTRPNAPGGKSVKRRLTAVLATLAVAFGLVAITAVAAEAHTGTLQVSSTCQNNGTYLLTFTGQTSSVPTSGKGHTATLTVGEIQPKGATPSGTPSTVVGNTSYSWTMTVRGSTTYAQATAYLQWGDGATADPQGTITLLGNCVPPKTPVSIQTAPTASPVCGPNNDTVKVPVDTYFDFTNSGWNNGQDTVTAALKQQYQKTYTVTGQTKWVFTDHNTVCPTPPAPPVVKHPTGHVNCGCRGYVKFTMNNKLSNRAVSYHWRAGVRSGNITVPAHSVRTLVVRHRAHGALVRLWALGKKLASTHVPAKCPPVTPPHSGLRVPVHPFQLG